MSHEWGGAFFPSVLPPRVREGIWAGVIAATGTAGALIGFGAARGSPARPLNAIAHLIVGSRGQATPGFDLLLTPIGLLLHIVSLVVWGVIFAHLGARLEGWRLAGAAILFAATIFVIDLYALPRRLSPGFQLTLSWGEVITVYGLMSLLLWLGVTLARQADGHAERGAVG